MSEYVIQGQTLTDIAAAIRAKSSTQEQYKPAQMAAAIEAIPSGGTEMEDMLVERPRTFVEYTNDRVTQVGSYAFYKSALESMSLPNVTSVGSYATAEMSAIKEQYWPKVTSVLSNSFYNIPKLERIAFDGTVNFQGQSSMAYCPALTAVVIRSDELCTLGNKNVLQRTPIADGGGYIYVPESLVEEYRAATNWATYAESIKGLSEAPQEVQEWLSSLNP